MKNLRKLLDKADNDVFDEIIKACEGKMVSPFKKEVAIVAEPEEHEIEQDDNSMEEGSEPKSKIAADDISPEDLQKLMDLYKQIKG